MTQVQGVIEITPIEKDRGWAVRKTEEETTLYRAMNGPVQLGEYYCTLETAADSDQIVGLIQTLLVFQRENP